MNEEEVKKLIEKINFRLKELNENTSKLFSILLKIEEEKKKIPEGYISFDFIEPLFKGKGLENFLLNVIKRESEKHNIEYILNKNKNDEIIQIFLKGDKEHIDHILNCCNWINKRIKELKEKQETKTVPKELM
jgi:hypothetical protein